MSMSSPVGEKLGITVQGLALVLKGTTWGVPINGVMYDGEFTGQTTPGGAAEVLIRKMSDNQPPQEKAV